VKEIGDVIRIVFSKVSGFFDIFDLSFFVSGLASATAITTYLHITSVPITMIVETKVGIFLAAIVSYSLGLISFASGRFIQQWFAKIYHSNHQEISQDHYFVEALKAHGLMDDRFVKEYFDRGPEGRSALYTLLWAQLRHSQRVSASLTLLNSYWVKAATYDGLAVSSILWFFLIVCNLFDWLVPNFLGLIPSIVSATILLIFIFACLREGQRYREYQAQELVATIASVGIKCDKINTGF
jgi:hypothetical protein